MLVVAGCRSRCCLLDEIVQNRRNTKVARRLLMRLLKKQGMLPKRMSTDKLRPYGAARRQIIPGVEHRSHKGLNNRAENSHLRFENGRECARAFVQSEVYSISFRCSPPSVISSSQITQSNLLPKSAFTDSKPWLNGKPPAARSSETVRRDLTRLSCKQGDNTGETDDCPPERDHRLRGCIGRLCQPRPIQPRFQA